METLDLISEYGGYGKVYKIKSKLDDKLYAIKKYNNSLDKGTDPLLIEQILREIGNLRRLNHPNIAKIRDFLKFNDKMPCIVLDLCDGSLKDFIVTNKGTQIEEQIIIKIILSVAEALEYIHSEGIVHRGLKPENILYKKDGD